MGPRAAKAIPVFLTALTDEDAVIRSAALEGFTKLKPDPQIGIVAVRPLLKDPFATNQTAAARALIDFGETQAGVTYLVAFLQGRGRSAAAAAIAQIGPDARSAVPGLIQMLESARNADERYWACRALAAIGRDASPALPVLEAAAASSDPSVRGAARYALTEIQHRR
jgi:HEAT repeat protein